MNRWTRSVFVPVVAMISAPVLGWGVQPVANKTTDEASRPYPKEVTAATRADASALAALQRSGEVFLVEGFESPDALRKYFEVRGEKEGRAVRTSDPAVAHAGVGAFRCTAVANNGGSSGAGASYWFGVAHDPKPPGPAVDPQAGDRIHFRYYIRWAEDYDQGNLNHTGGSLVGVSGDNKWAGMGSAGLRPRGDDHFSTGFEGWTDWGRTPPPGLMFSYTYWMDMKIDKDGHYWGNMMTPAQPTDKFVPKRGVWYCMEQMVRLNTIKDGVPLDDGELATWIDGVLYTHFTGFRWRSSEAVKLKRAGFGVYVHESVKDNTVWYDDLALSTGYIGPIKPAPKRDRTVESP